MNLEEKNIEKYIYGTTIFIGKLKLNLEKDDIITFTFQDLITKNYVIALSSKILDLTKPIYSRVHSSCITSETLGSIDCDCLPQLNMALDKIIEHGGIIFYLIQEGRGCGYIGKSRACMLVQNDPDKYNTFTAYQHLGMKEDYRQYDNIKDILFILDIEPKFILLTNNPQKIEGFKKAGLIIHSTESLISEPNAYNLSYLLSKRKNGHRLKNIPDNLREITNFVPVKPFDPYPLKDLRRFVHASSYYLPITPINGKILIHQKYLESDITHYKIGEYKVIKKNLLPTHLEKKIVPFWFRVNVYYDVINQTDIVIIDYKDHTRNLDKITPLIRIHSESLFNRFPVKYPSYKSIYQKSLEHILTNGIGKVVLFYHDGKGFGLGNFILNKTGDNYDKEGRDYHSVAQLLNSIMEEKSVSLLYSCDRTRSIAIKSFNDLGICINKTYYIGMGNEKLGHNLIKNRFFSSFNYLQYNRDMVYPNNIKLMTDIVISGIGSSYSHAEYLNYLLNKYCNDLKVKCLHLSDLYNNSNISNKHNIIIFSQGLSTHIHKFIEQYSYKDNIILITSRETNYNGHRVNINCDLEKDTLLRIEGPLEVYFTCIKLVEYLSNKIIIDDKYKTDLEYLDFYREIHQNIPNNEFTECLVEHKNLCIIATYPVLEFLNNVKMKFVEGAGITNVILISNHEFAHGTYQSICNQSARYPIIIIDNNLSKESSKNLKLTLEGSFPLWDITPKLESPLEIIEIELIINNYIIQLMDLCKFDQINWTGKEKQHLMYNSL